MADPITAAPTAASPGAAEVIAKLRDERDRIFANYSRLSASSGMLVAALEQIENPLCLEPQDIAHEALRKFKLARQSEIKEKELCGPRVGRIPNKSSS